MIFAERNRGSRGQTAFIHVASKGVYAGGGSIAEGVVARKISVASKDGRISRLDEYLDSGQTTALMKLARGG